MGNSNWSDKSYSKPIKVKKINPDNQSSRARVGLSWKDMFTEADVKEILAEKKKK